MLEFFFREVRSRKEKKILTGENDTENEMDKERRFTRMKYEDMMEECAHYMKEHRTEGMNAGKMSQIYCYTKGYFSYLFSAYFEMTADEYGRRLSEDESFSEIPRRQVDESKISVFYQQLPEFSVAAMPMVPEEAKDSDPIEMAAQTYIRKKQDPKHRGKTFASVWWHDENCRMYYLMGPVITKLEERIEKSVRVSIPSSRYAIFSYDEKDPGGLAYKLKNLVCYVHGPWMKKNRDWVDECGYIFEVYEKDQVYLFLPLFSEKKKKEPEDKVYGVDTWTKYIDEHIMENIPIPELAKMFHYSVQHFRHVFRLYYDMSVSDYIRKRKLQMAAEELRQGHKLIEVALKYGFKTPAGFTRAFENEFNVTPGAYSKGTFEVVDLTQYYNEYKDRLKVSIVNIKELKMIGHTILDSRGEDVDIPAQIYYWMDKDFPCLANTRFSCNRQRREDKIAMWYHKPEYINIEYIMGPVVDDFREVPDDMIPVTIDGGKYAIFETDRQSDKENVSDTIRMYSRCVFFGWVKEHRERVDLMRFTFERYIDNKIYMYVPIKN